MSKPKTLNPVELSKLACDEFDELRRPAPEKVGFEAVVERGLNRRDFFKGAAMLFILNC